MHYGKIMESQRGIVDNSFVWWKPAQHLLLTATWGFVPATCPLQLLTGVTASPAAKHRPHGPASLPETKPREIKSLKQSKLFHLAGKKGGVCVQLIKMKPCVVATPYQICRRWSGPSPIPLHTAGRHCSCPATGSSWMEDWPDDPCTQRILQACHLTALEHLYTQCLSPTTLSMVPVSFIRLFCFVYRLQ